MKKFLLTVILVVFTFLNFETFAQDQGFGLGIMIGKPTAISSKYWLSENTAADFGLGYSILDDAGFTLHTDFLYHQDGLFESSEKIVVHYGFGARLKANDNNDTSLGARGVIGLTWMSKQSPIDAFIELAPVFKLIPKTALGFDLALGARYYFNTK
ncbi:MAG: hypothetical protein JEY94_06705 [Melioribacteraceae bacterium]|nr:hypothetical protein [Melioribacteraceae bacterium]